MQRTRPWRLGHWLAGAPPAAWAMSVIACGAMVWVGLASTRGAEGRAFWTFAQMHLRLYEPVVADWNASNELQVRPVLLSIPALERRMMGGFLADVAVADLMEVERRIATRAFAGPLETVGFLDLTDRLRQEGLLERINSPSFSPWTKGGRIFGLPHDVHPVLLCYRADLVEQAGIDVDSIETWDDFEREMRPLMADKNGDGEPDRYLIAFWDTRPHRDTFEALLLQAGGGFFDENDRPVIDSDVNARALARFVTWMVGPNRIAIDAAEFSAGGNKQKIDGDVICAVMPDWLCDHWKQNLPQLKGKVKLMPIPAWAPGGRRTTVWGGTMLGIARDAEDPDALWEFAKHLYLSDELARALYTEGQIITPVTEHWDDPVFDEPDPYFQGQAKGRLYIQAAPDVPRRSASPHGNFALDEVLNALFLLRQQAERMNTYDRETLAIHARELLADVQRQVAGRIERNAFAEPGS